MSAQGIQIDRERCTLCGACVAACPFDALKLDDAVRVDFTRCTLCGACVEACPCDAISRPEAKPAVVAGTWRDVWVFVETDGERIHPVVFELLGEGRRLADALGERLVAVLLGRDVRPMTVALLAAGADLVRAVERPELACLQDEPYAAVLAELIRRYQPAIVLCGATPTGRSLIPRVAVLAGAGLTADCTALAIDPQTRRLLQTRPAFGGNLFATIECPTARPQMATVRPRVMKPGVADPARHGEVRHEEVAEALLAVRAVRVGYAADVSATVGIAEADVVVAGGRGMQQAAKFGLLEELAKVLGGGVGASRAAVDAGWAPYARQVGQTGRTVSPRLYIACGISGQVQHLAGMSSAEIIVAINKDPDAPIFKVANYGLVGDVLTILPLLTAALRQTSAMAGLARR